MMSTQQKTDVNVIAVENNSYSCIALDDEGRVWTWGDNNNEEQLGRASAVKSNKVNPHNRGGQVTDTIYPGVTLPFILQISGSYQNSLVLDRDGNVWSWGRDNDGALGRANRTGTRPGKVEFPGGVKMKWIAAGYNSGKSIDVGGNIWVWGRGEQYNNGTGSTGNLSVPVMLTLDSSNNPLPTNFTKISSSDFNGRCAAIAVTEDGKVFTWGNSASAVRGGASRPCQTGFNGDIKKIDVGNGTYGFLTHSGEIWTWGDNDTTAGDGRQGHGDTNNRATPKKIENVVNSGTKPAPKFRDFSLYAWSTCAVDHEGNLYAAGSDNLNKHATSGVPRVLTKYTLPRDVPEGTKILIVAEGYYSTSHIDIYGNAYVTGNSDTYGINNNDGSVAGRWVHFNGSGKPMFTVLSSSPTSEAKRYNTSPKTTLNVETNIPSDEVKYVILYPEDTETYTDGERFYDKSFAEIEPPYYLKGTDPQLLLSPNYDLWTSRYYANPKISEDVFNTIYNQKGGSEKGTMEIAEGSGAKVFIEAELVSHNCIVWVQSKNAVGTTRAIYRFDNYYTQTKAYVEGVKLDDPSFKLYQPELIGGGYGLFLDRQGELIPGVPPFGYDNVMPDPKVLTYWTPSPGSQTDVEVAEDGYTHRVDRSKEIFLTELSQKGDEAAKTPRVTFSYIKDPAMWVGATLKFVNEDNEAVQVMIGEEIRTEDYRPMFAPKGVEHVVGQDPYLPPEAVIDTTKVVGYSVTNPPDGTPESYTACSFPDGFKPMLNAESTIYIVYSTGMLSVTESFVDISMGGSQNIPNNDGLLSAVKNNRNGAEYQNQSPPNSRYVIVGHQITEGAVEHLPVEYPWDQDRYVPQSAKIDAVSEESTVKFLYKADDNGNNIPDEEEGTITARWIAVNANNASYRIAEKTYVGNGAKGASLTIDQDKEHVLPEALYDPDRWIFRPGQPSDVAPYLPQGSTAIANISFAVGPMEPIYFYYDEDFNGNGVADKDEGYFTEKYRLAGSRADLTPPREDVPSKWLGGETYHSTAPLIANYVAVGYWVEAVGVAPVGTDRVDRELTGDVSFEYVIPLDGVKKNYTVTFLYKEDANNNNIPDDEEGSVTIRWVGTTFAGNTVEIEKREIVGYDGDDVTEMIFPPNPIDDVWKLVSSTVPDDVFLTRPPSVYEYQYTEALEFATIIVENTSTDGKLNFSYQYSKRLTDDAFDVVAFPIPTYRITGYDIYDDYGTPIGSGVGDTVRIDPATGSQKIVFGYQSTVTTVVVRAIEADDHDNVLYSQTITDAVIGQKYAAAAPYVDDTWVLLGDVLQAIDVVEGANSITFEYQKATGNVTVLLKEQGQDGSDERIIRVIDETVEQGTYKDIEIPNLSGSHYTQISTEMQRVDFGGAEPAPKLVEYFYAKDMMDVSVHAIDDADGAVLKTATETGVARKGESYTAAAPTVEWYTVAESNTKTVYADPAAPGNTIAVDFAFKKDDNGDIVVRFFYVDEDGDEVELGAYTARCIVGSKFAANASRYPGFARKGAEWIEIVVDADRENNRINFEYTESMGVFTQIGEDVTTRKQIPTSMFVSGHAEDGEDVTVIPPYMYNHLVVGYIKGDDEPEDAVPETFERLTIDSQDAPGVHSVVFIFKPFQDIVEDRYLNVTVVGVTGALTHYSHEMRIPRSELPKTLSVPDDVFDVHGYALDSGADFIVAEPLDDAPLVKTFGYHSLASTVTIRMVDGTGTDVAESFTIAATTGQPQTYNAPSVPGHYLAGNALGKVDAVEADGSSEIVFTYEKITSMVTIIAREDDANGRVIGVFEVSSPIQGDNAYPVPDLSADFYTAIDPTVNIDFDGTNSVSAEAYYTKDLASVGIDAVHYRTGADLGAQAPLQNQRKGEAVSVGAPNIAGHILVGNASQLVVADGVNKAVFKYRPLASDEVVVKAVDTDGNILQSHILKGDIGETITAEPPTITGWKTNDAAKSAIIGTDADIVFDYAKDVVSVTIDAVDSEGNALSSTVSEAPKGGSFTAYAPHIPGYAVVGSGVYPLANLAADEVVTFSYQPVEASAVIVTVIGSSEDGELYRDIIIRTANSGAFEVEAKTVPEYRLISASPATIDVQDQDVIVTFEYESVYTTVTVHMVDEDTNEFVTIYVNWAETHKSYTFHAPEIVGYVVTSNPPVGTIDSVLPNGASEMSFTYKRGSIG